MADRAQNKRFVGNSRFDRGELFYRQYLFVADQSAVFVKTRHVDGLSPRIAIVFKDKAIAIASEKTESVVKDYSAAPVYFSEAENGAHEWLIEFEKEPRSLQEFTYELDSALKTINSDYEAKRHKDIALRMPLIKAVPSNTFTNWLSNKGKLGGQHKVPRLSNERDTIEEIKQFVGIDG